MLARLSNSLRSTLRELFAYGVSAVGALGVDMGVLLLLADVAHWPYLVAATASFVAGGVFLYFASVTVVFRVRRITNPALELTAFLALGVAGLVVNLVVIALAVELAHASYVVAKGASAVCTFGANFLLRRNMMFSQPRPS